MAARTKSKITPKYKTKYRVKNWATYEAALKKRGDITVWFDEGAIRAWNAPLSGRPGGQPRYSDLAIVTALTLRTVFHLALRQTEGFVASVGVTMIEEIGAVIERSPARISKPAPRTGCTGTNGSSETGCGQGSSRLSGGRR